MSQFTLDKQFTVSGNNITLNLDGTKDTPVIKAILNNSPFPAGEIVLGEISVRLPDGSAPVTLGDPDGKNVQFSFTEGSTSYQMQVVTSPAAALKAISPERNIAAGVQIAGRDGERFMLLNLKYDIGATAKGSVALSTGLTGNFSGSGSRKGEWAIVRRFSDQGARDILTDIFAAWILPRQFDDVDRLQPGTWLITEVDGSVALNLGVQAGYDFSWVRQLTNGSLTGDLGLKVELAASAAFGFSANGSYALALSRPDETRKIRLTLYKLASIGWDFTLNASAGIQGVLPPGLQSSSDITDLARAIFGTHMGQLLNDLSQVQKVATGGSLTDQAASFIVGLGKKDLPGTGTSIDQLYNAGVDRLGGLLSRLENFGQHATNVLVSMMSDNSAEAIQDLATVRGVLTQIKTAGQDPSKIGGILQTELQQVAFFQTGIGRLLASGIKATPFATLLNKDELLNVGTFAGQALDILNGKDLQDLADYAKDKLQLRPLPPLDQMDAWLRHKVAAFLGKSVPALIPNDLKQVQDCIDTIFTKADQFYSAAIAAAQKQYAARLLMTYQQSATNTALIDVTFDFDRNPNMLAIVKDAINGDFTRILLDPGIPGIALHNAALSHGVKRQTHVELTLPFVKLGSSAIRDTLASVSAQDDGGGRVLAYQAKSTNDVASFVKARSQRDSQMTMVSSFTAPVPGITRHHEFSANLSYSLHASNVDTTRDRLLTLLRPIVDSYLPDIFPSGSGLETWIDNLAQMTGSKDGHFGQTLLSLDVSVPPDAMKAWVTVSSSKSDDGYRALSKRIQERLRRLISTVYFARIDHYHDLNAAYPLVAYSAMRSANSFDVDGNGHAVYTGKDIYWNPDMEHLGALLNDPLTVNDVRLSLSSIEQVLAAAGDNRAQFYGMGNLTAVLSTALRRSNPANRMPDLLGGLIFFEAQLVSEANQAARALANLLKQGATNPTEALKAMNSFGDAITGAFNEHMSGGLFEGPELAMLGSALFAEVSQALAESTGPEGTSDIRPIAMVSITIPQSGSGLGPEDLVAGHFKPADILADLKLMPRLSA